MRVWFSLTLVLSASIFVDSALTFQDAKADPLIGEWESKDTVDGKELIGRLEFGKEGKLKLTVMGFNFDGTYRVLDEKSMEVTLKIGEKSSSQKITYKIDADKL
jgi:uncharacterized protein (TIGR03066 family)